MFFIIVLAFLLAFIAYFFGIRINTSSSIPVGFYKLKKLPPKTDSYVIFCPPQNEDFYIARSRGYINAGFCPGGYGHLVKKILAAKDDIVSVTKDGVVVNGKLLSYSKPFTQDIHGYKLRQLIGNTYLLSDNQIFLMTDQDRLSFDSRYFGPVDRKQIISVII